MDLYFDQTQQFRVENIFMNLFLTSTQLFTSLNWWTGVVLMTSVLLWWFYQLFGHSDGTHSLQRIHWWASDVCFKTLSCAHTCGLITNLGSNPEKIIKNTVVCLTRLCLFGFKTKTNYITLSLFNLFCDILYRHQFQQSNTGSTICVVCATKKKIK